MNKFISHTGLFRIGLLSILALFVAVGVSTPAYAQTNDQKVQVQVVKLRCTVAEAKLTTKVEQIDSSKKTHETVYSGILKKVAMYASMASQAGYDAAAFTGAQAKTQSALDSYSASVATFSTSLESAKKLACGESDTDFDTALAKARTDLVSVRTSSQTLKDTVKTSVIPSLKDYSTWIKDNSITVTHNHEAMKGDQ